MDNEREPELREETLDLVRELGERLEEEAPGPQPQPQARMAWRAEPDPDEQKRIESLRRELEFADRQMAELSGRYARLRAELRRLQGDDAVRERELAAMDRSRRAGHGVGLPEYLRGAEHDIMFGRTGAYWLHGEDARERARAVEALATRLAAGGKLSWATAIVDLTRRDVRRRNRLESDLEFAVRQAWDAWTGEPADPPPGLLDPATTRMAYAGRAGVAIILTDFPARKKMAAGFLAWLVSGMTASRVPLLVFVSTNSPPSQDSPCQPVLCETAAARLGRRVAELRLKRGWNRADLAERMDMPESMIRKMEAGLRESWDERILWRLAGVLDASPDDLMRG